MNSSGSTHMRKSRSRQDSANADHSLTRPVAALIALALAAVVAPLPPPAQATTCQPVQRGILNPNNTFSRGTSARHNDYRVICRGDSSGRDVRSHHIGDAFDHPNADEVIEDNFNRFVVQLSNAYLDWYDEDFDDITNVVLLGTAVRSDAGRHGIAMYAPDGVSFWDGLTIDSHANIRTTGGGQGITVWSAKPHYGPLRVRNFGSIETTGGGPSHGNRRGRGINVESNGGYAETVNETGGSVETRGPGARAVTAGSTLGSATAINRGTITTYGNGFRRGSSLQTSDALYSWNVTGGIALATNDAGGVVETRGTGARGVRAGGGRAEGRSGSGGGAIAINRGRVTTRGNMVTGRTNRPADGVAAWSDSGIARATNETRATIRTYGTGAKGVRANDQSIGGRAEAENRGTITTSGRNVGNTLATGVFAISSHNTAYGVNHHGARVTTTGSGARGVEALTINGGPHESAVAINHGTITTSGSSTHTATGSYRSSGLFSSTTGEASAVAINTHRGVIEARGTGAAGVWAQVTRGGGEAIARNQGRITTRGDAYRVDRPGTSNDTYRTARGLGAYSQHADATATNDAGGVIETRGTVATGVSAWSDGGGTATAVNRGRVTTRGGALRNLPRAVGRTLGSTGVLAHSADADARIVNDTTGRVDTYGTRAFGLHVESGGDGSRTSTTTEVINRGQVRTRGYNADGAVAIALHGGTATNPNQVRATSASRATITTGGTGSSGLVAGIAVRGGGTRDGYGSAIARNDGTVTTTGGAVGNRAGADAANGVVAAFFAPDRTRIRNGGDVTLVNTGDVTVRGTHASALYAETFGRGTATVRVLGGEARAEHFSGRGLWARTGSAGRVDTTIAGGSVVAGRTARHIAAQFQGGTTNVRLLDSTFDGRVVFGSGRDTFTVRNGRVTGAIAFGSGTDTLNVHGDAWLEGGWSTLARLNLRGRGNLVVRGNATFSSGGQAVLENGGLSYSGHFNLGTGSMRIHDAARLTAVLDNPNAPPRITARGGLTFDGDEELFVQVTSAVSAARQSTYLSQLNRTAVNPITHGTRIRGRTGRVALRTAHGTSRVVEVGHIPLTAGRTRAPGTVVRSGVRLGVVSLDAPANLSDLTTTTSTLTGGVTSLLSTPGEPDLVVGGGVAQLGATLFGTFDAEVPTYAPDETPYGEAPAMPGYLSSRAQDGGLEYWTRAWTGDAPVLAGGAESTVRGYALGVDAPLGEGFRLGVSTAPGLAVSSVSDGRRTGARARLDGTRVALRGSWRGEVLHAGLSLSQGRYEAQSVFDNPVAGGGLAGRYDLAQEHAHLGVGARLSWGGIQVTPSLSAHAGTLRHGAYTAHGPVFRAQVPGFSQRYHGWRSELRVAPERWWRGPKSLRWRPALQLYTQRTQTTGLGTLDVSQRDRAGVLSLTSRARVSGLPGTVHGLGATVDAVRSEGWRLQLGVAGMRADGESDRAVLARLHVRF